MVKNKEYMNIVKPSIVMRKKPDDSLNLETECLFGESIEILDTHSDWLFCILKTDNYYGWIKKEGVEYLGKATHRVLNKRTFIFEKKDIKASIIHYLPMGSQICVVEIDDNWSKVLLSRKHICLQGYVPSKHIIQIDKKIKDWVSKAEQLINTPYKWGGRDTIGIDCSALLQLSYATYGEMIPRNTSDQIKLPKKLITSTKNLSRGAVVFWEGHVGIMIDHLNCIHANAFHMKTVIEPLQNIRCRIEKDNKLIKILDFNEIN